MLILPVQSYCKPFPCLNPSVSVPSSRTMHGYLHTNNSDVFLAFYNQSIHGETHLLNNDYLCPCPSTLYDAQKRFSIRLRTFKHRGHITQQSALTSLSPHLFPHNPQQSMQLEPQCPPHPSQANNHPHQNSNPVTTPPGGALCPFLLPLLVSLLLIASLLMKVRRKT